jgi:hypothetical protein
VDSAPLAEGMLAEYAKAKRAEAKRATHVDVDDLAEQGKWLSREEQSKLSQQLDSYFSHSCLNPSKPPSTEDAWKFQGCLVLHLLNGNNI